MTYIYEIRRDGRYPEDSWTVGYALTVTAAVKHAEGLFAASVLDWIEDGATPGEAYREAERFIVLRHRPVEEQVGMNDDCYDRVWTVEEGWTGV